MLRTTTKRTTLLLFAFVVLSIKAIAQANDCASATNINPATTCGTLTNQTLYNSTGVGSPTSTCGATTNDVWYTVTVPAGVTNVSVTVTPNNGSNLDNTNTFVELFNATTCAGVTTGNSLGCGDIGSAVNFTGLTSTVHYMRIFTTANASANPSNKWVYSICVTYTAAPTNNECSAATALTSGVANTNGTVWAATASSSIPVGCATGNPDDDVWYSITTASNATLGVALSSLGSDITSSSRLQLFSGACGGLSSLACGTTSVAATVTSGTYYIRVYSSGTTTVGRTSASSTGSTFSITATITLPPGNDNCGSATALTSGSTVAGTVLAATASGGIPVGCATGDPDDDVWYSFNAAASASLNIGLSAVGSDLTTSGPRIQFYSGTCGALTSVDCGTTGLITSVTAGNTYYIRVYSAGTGSNGLNSTFSITATATFPPGNDECAGAVTLSSGVMNSSGTVWGATTSASIPVGCSSGTPDDDVWYKITPANNVLTVTLSAIGSNLSTSGTRMQLFSGTCASLTSIGCGKTKIVRNVNAGTTYYIRVYSAGSGSIGGVASGSAFSITATASSPTTVTGGRMKEVYQQTTLSGANVLEDPWEVTYGPDGNLWITEAKGYKAYKMDPYSGEKTMILDISQGSTFFSSPSDQAFNCQFDIGTNNPQGGFAGLALHPLFLDPSTPKNYVYISYVHTYVGGAAPTGRFYINRVVRFTYNTTTEKLESPVSLCDTLPGSNDHNSQRLIVAPVGSTYYLFYAAGDMGAGQFDNRTRPIHAQDVGYYEGKILRFNLEEDADAGSGLNGWIPNDNPYSATSAVWCIGIRNNQGFALNPVTGYLYGSSHGPYSDDELNKIEPGKNYGHPLVIGYAADSNYDGSGAGANTTSSCPIIVHEVDNAAAIGATYKDALYSAYPTTRANINNIYLTNPGNGGWPSEGWSGMGYYGDTYIPGWKNSLVVSSLKWGRVLKFKLNGAGTAVIPTGAYDTVSYFGSTNRFRDVAFGPAGKDLFVSMERSTTSSGPSAGNPIVPACAGCIQKYSFLGYNDVSGKSSIPTSIDVTTGTANSCATGTAVTIEGVNNNLWVPITGPDGNIMAEIKANNQNLGAITSSFYTNSGALRVGSSRQYLDRNITITPAVQPGSSVNVRLYISKAEFDALNSAVANINSISDLKVLKNNDACGSAMSGAITEIVPDYAEAHGANGYMLQITISGFSSFYFAGSSTVLPLTLLSFKGTLQGSSALLEWETENEMNTSHFELERSVDGRNFSAITTMAAAGTSSSKIRYNYPDNNIASLSVNTIFYRLKLVDADGKFTYSNIITITLPNTGKITVFPIPAEKDIRVTINSTAADKAEWKILDNAGRVILKGNSELIKGYNEIPIDLSKLSSGVYYLNVSGTTIDQRVKIQKQ